MAFAHACESCNHSAGYGNAALRLTGHSVPGTIFEIFQLLLVTRT